MIQIKTMKKKKDLIKLFLYKFIKRAINKY